MSMHHRLLCAATLVLACPPALAQAQSGLTGAAVQGDDDIVVTGTRRASPPAKTAATRQALATAGLAAFMENGFCGHADDRRGGACRRRERDGVPSLRGQGGLVRRGAQEVRARHCGWQDDWSAPPGEATHAFLRRTLLPRRERYPGQRWLSRAPSRHRRGRALSWTCDIYRAVAIDPVLRLTRAHARRAVSRGELRAGTISRKPLLLAAPMVLGAVWNNLFGRDDPQDVAAMRKAISTWS